MQDIQLMSNTSDNKKSDQLKCYFANISAHAHWTLNAHDRTTLSVFLCCFCIYSTMMRDLVHQSKPYNFSQKPLRQYAFYLEIIFYWLLNFCQPEMQICVSLKTRLNVLCVHITVYICLLCFDVWMFVARVPLNSSFRLHK